MAFENDTVRLLEVTVPPGTREPEHVHPWPSVMLVVERARIRYYEGDQLTFESPDQVAPVDVPVGQWMEPEGPHSIENVDNRPFRAYRFELKSGG